MTKYAGSFHVLAESEEMPTDFTETVIFKTDGRCTRSTPAVDDNGAVTNTPLITQGRLEGERGCHPDDICRGRPGGND